jgi:hypothetical protein
VKRGRHILVALVLGLLAALLDALMLAQPWSTRIDVGGLLDSPFLRKFHAPESNASETFRWSQPQSGLVIPGVSQPVVLELRRCGGTPETAIQLDDGAGTSALALRPGWRRLRLLPRPDPWSGEVRIGIMVPTQLSSADPRPRGVAVDWVGLRGMGGATAPGQAILLGVNIALATLLASWAARQVWLGALVGTALALANAAVLHLAGGAWRPLLTVDTARLTLALTLGGALALAVDRGLAGLAARGVVQLASSTRRTLSGIALLTFLLRFVALTYPLTYVLDIKYHLFRTWMVRQGRFLELFLPNLALTPKQWKSASPIPYSPLYYLVTVPVTFLPGPGDRLGMLAFSSAVEALGVLVVAALVLWGGGGGRAATLAALLAATISYGLFWSASWGLFPTLLGQCLSLLAMAAWLYLRPRLHERRALALLAAALALAYLSYPTALLFTGFAWATLLVLLALRRDPAATPTLWAGLLAALVALVLYYGWHLPVLISTTLPTVLGAMGGSGGLSGESTAFKISSFWEILLYRYEPVVLILAGCGMALLLFGGWRLIEKEQDAARPPLSRRQALRLLMLAWCAVYPPFAVADFYVPLVEKQALHLLPAIAVSGGLLLDALWRRRWGKVVALALLALVFWLGVSLTTHEVIYAYWREK